MHQFGQSIKWMRAFDLSTNSLAFETSTFTRSLCSREHSLFCCKHWNWMSESMNFNGISAFGEVLFATVSFQGPTANRDCSLSDSHFLLGDVRTSSLQQYQQTMIWRKVSHTLHSSLRPLYFTVIVCTCIWIRKFDVISERSRIDILFLENSQRTQKFCTQHCLGKQWNMKNWQMNSKTDLLRMWGKERPEVYTLHFHLIWITFSIWLRKETVQNQSATLVQG